MTRTRSLIRHLVMINNYIDLFAGFERIVLSRNRRINESQIVTFTYCIRRGLLNFYIEKSYKCAVFLVTDLSIIENPAV